MSLLTQLLKDKKHKREVIEQQIAALDREMKESIDPASKIKLADSIRQHEHAYQLLEKEIAALKNQRLLESDAEAVHAHIVNLWKENSHYVDYKPPLNALTPILASLNAIGGGVALFILPERSRVCSEFLLRRVRCFVEYEQQSKYLPRPVALSSVEENGVLDALLQTFGHPPHGTALEKINTLVDTLYESHLQDNTVIALEVTVKPAKISPQVFAAFLSWFIRDLWKVMVERHPSAAQQTEFLRIVVFLLTELKDDQLPATLYLAAPNYALDKCVLVKVDPWEEEDLKVWLHKFSQLKAFGYQRDQIDGFGAAAHEVGEGIPLFTWRQLSDILSRELTDCITRMKNGKLAAVQI